MELTPDFEISINGANSIPKDRVISIRTTDEAGFVSDDCELELDDFDNSLVFPNTEAKIVVSLGYKETGVVRIGSYYVKEITIDGARNRIKIHGNAAPKAMRNQTTTENEGSLLDKISDYGEGLGLSSSITFKIKGIFTDDNPQIAESDTSYVTRLAKKVGAIVKPTDDHLVVMDDMSGQSASGKNLPTIYIDATDVASYSCSFKETESEGGTGTVKAKWFEKEKGEYHTESVGDGTPIIEIQEIFGDKEQALSAAQARLKNKTKSDVTFSFSVMGNVDLFAEGKIILRGFPSKIPTSWIITRAEHSLSASGFVTNCECAKGG